MLEDLDDDDVRRPGEIYSGGIGRGEESGDEGAEPGKEEVAVEGAVVRAGAVVNAPLCATVRSESTWELAIAHSKACRWRREQRRKRAGRKVVEVGRIARRAHSGDRGEAGDITAARSTSSSSLHGDRRSHTERGMPVSTRSCTAASQIRTGSTPSGVVMKRTVHRCERKRHGEQVVAVRHSVSSVTGIKVSVFDALRELVSASEVSSLAIALSMSPSSSSSSSPAVAPTRARSG